MSPSIDPRDVALADKEAALAELLAEVRLLNAYAGARTLVGGQGSMRVFSLLSELVGAIREASAVGVIGTSVPDYRPERLPVALAALAEHGLVDDDPRLRLHVGRLIAACRRAIAAGYLTPRQALVVRRVGVLHLVLAIERRLKRIAGKVGARGPAPGFPFDVRHQSSDFDALRQSASEE